MRNVFRVRLDAITDHHRQTGDELALYRELKSLKADLDRLYNMDSKEALTDLVYEYVADRLAA